LHAKGEKEDMQAGFGGQSIRGGSRSPCYGRTAENRELGASALFENEKSRDSYGFTPQKSRQVSK